MDAHISTALKNNGIWIGRMHSRFAHAVNFMLHNSHNTKRLLTVAEGSPFRIPDALFMQPECVSDGELILKGDQLMMGGERYSLAFSTWTGRIPVYGTKARAREFWEMFRQMRLVSGFCRLPDAIGLRAVRAIASGDIADVIGLGAGLTPSVDDAAVGWAAFQAAKGKAWTIDETELNRTTDVSAKYLRLASEGFFSEALTLLMDAVFGSGDLARAMADTASIGATSGADMLFGIAIACAQDLHIPSREWITSISPSP
ncbi:hypothetical protein AGMMS49992_11000 [Clostridia bacterium]|nr:hypothetical protein AGMMS49992_11000 [Clostridia bacterium]